MTDAWGGGPGPPGLLAVIVFLAGYAAVIVADRAGARRSLPMLLAAGLMWGLVGLAFARAGHPEATAEAARRHLAAFAELFLFVIAAVTFVNTLAARGLFRSLGARLLSRGWSLRRLYWALGACTLGISAIVDNMTAVLVMGSLLLAVGDGKPRFQTVGCIQLVVAANAGGAFSPFGDLTTLMVWQQGALPFQAFFTLALPALVNWLVPTCLMASAVEAGAPAPHSALARAVAPGTGGALAIAAGTLTLTVVARQVLGLPPALAMVTGLGVLQGYTDWHERRASRAGPATRPPAHQPLAPANATAASPPATVDPYRLLEQTEWDTLLFFYGVLLAVGALDSLGLVAAGARALYGHLGPTATHVLVGLASALVDNIPVMYAVLATHPTLGTGQWLLVTLATGVGGSLLSVGSAAGIALMGQARGIYTFRSHARWSWAIALGYAASLATLAVLERGAL